MELLKYLFAGALLLFGSLIALASYARQISNFRKGS